jgi:N-acetylmuramoyl-L-alanine amidase
MLLRNGVTLGKTTVMIDPGHGGPVDTGAVAPTGMPEKELNLAVAEAVQVALGARGIVALLTRTADYSSPLYVRANLADTLEVDLMVSIHHNAPSPPPSNEPGIEVFFQDGSSRSQRLGGLLWEHSMDALGEFEVNWVAAEDSGVMTVINTRGDDAYGIVRHPETTTVLIELGYISNRSEAELQASPLYRDAVGTALAEAIDLYLTTVEPGFGFVDGRVFDPRPGIAKDACIDPAMGN